MRPIDGEKLEEILEKWLKECSFCAPDDNVEGQAVYTCLCQLQDMPTLDVVTVVHGRWIDNGIQGSMLSGCSVCGFTCGAYTFNYCPNCGARMDKE